MATLMNNVEIMPSTTDGRNYTECGVILHAPFDQLTDSAKQFIAAVNTDRCTQAWQMLTPIEPVNGIIHMPINYKRTTARIGKHWWKVPYSTWQKCTLAALPGGRHTDYKDGVFVLNLLGSMFTQWCKEHEVN